MTHFCDDFAAFFLRSLHFRSLRSPPKNGFIEKKKTPTGCETCLGLGIQRDHEQKMAHFRDDFAAFFLRSLHFRSLRDPLPKYIAI